MIKTYKEFLKEFIQPYEIKAIRYNGEIYLAKPGESVHFEIINRLMKTHHLSEKDIDNAMEGLTTELEFLYYNTKTRKFRDLQ